MKKFPVIDVRHKFGYNGALYLIVPDHASGRPNRYTIYRIPASPSRRVKIVGKELTLGYSKNYVKRLIEKELHEKFSP